MSTIVALSYFHRKIGPLVYSAYPDLLDTQLSVRIANIMDQTFDPGFFKHSFENLNSMNYYFEIHSDWARGNKEMLMISIIVDKQTSSEVEKNVHVLCKEFSDKLQSNEGIFAAFYINDLSNFDDVDKERIIKNDSLIKEWVKDLYWATIEVTREKTEEEKIAILMNKRHIFLTLEKLSKGPISTDDLEEWFLNAFPERNIDDFNNMIANLGDKQFIFVNQIGLVEKYIILLKEVNAERIPPESVILFIDDKPELIDLLLPKVQEYFSEYETKTPIELKEDAFNIFQIMANPSRYNVLSQLRNDIIQRDKLPKLVSKSALNSYEEILDYLKKYDVIEEIKYNEERYVVLKTNLQITTSFPKYLSKLLPKESKPVIANKYDPKDTEQEKQREMAEIFKVVRKESAKKEETKAKETKISTFLEDLSSRPRREESKK